MTKIYLTNTPEARTNYYGDRALDELRTLDDVSFNALDRPLTRDEFAKAAAGLKSWLRPRRCSSACRISSRSAGSRWIFAISM
jgi:hypothetical protein